MSFNLINLTTITLISTARANYNSTLAAYGTANPAALNSILLAASGKIVRYCKRDFTSTTYTEYYDGGGLPYQRLALRQFPVTDITRVATSPTTVLSLTNTDTVTNQRATVETIGMVLRLKRVASAVTTVIDLGTTTYPTLASMAAAINATAGSWSATVQSGYSLYPTADLNVLQGAADTLRNPANLEIHVEDVYSMTGSSYDSGGLYRGGSGWRLDSVSGELWGAFPQGIQNIRVDYTAGFAVIPDAVQEACVLFAQDLIQTEAANRAIKSGSLGPYKFEYAADAMAMSKAVRDMLSEYVAHDKTVLS